MYIKKHDFDVVLRESLQKGQITPTCLNYFMKIAKELSRKLKYKDEMDREDCVQYGLENCVRYWKKYDPDRERANPFSYFTQVIKTGMAQGFNKLNGKKGTKIIKVSIDENFNF